MGVFLSTPIFCHIFSTFYILSVFFLFFFAWLSHCGHPQDVLFPRPHAVAHNQIEGTNLSAHMKRFVDAPAYNTPVHDSSEKQKHLSNIDRTNLSPQKKKHTHKIE
jgi:hypothetical protein